MLTLVTGMHRSGTSMMAKVLNACGVYLGHERDLIPANSNNPEGHWEHADIVLLNDEILNELGGAWDCPPCSDADWARVLSSGRFRDRGEALLNELEAYKPCGFKDPRASLTLPFWRAVSPDVKVVMCVRNPLEVALSLKRRGLSSYMFGLRLWWVYNQRLLDSIPASQCLVTHYASLVGHTEQELRRIVDFLEIDAPPDVVSRAIIAVQHQLRHNQFTTDHLLQARVTPAIVKLYLHLCDCAGWSDSEPVDGFAGAQPPECRPQDCVGDGLPQSRVVDAAAMDTALHRRELVSVWASNVAKDATIAEQEDTIRRLLAEADALKHALSGAERRGASLQAAAASWYHHVTRRVIELVETAVPPGLTVLVVSRGDDALLNVGGRTCWHFPRLNDGCWAGFYPANSQAAIAHLDALSAEGATHIVFPETSQWWLQYYEEFANYLRMRGRIIAERDDAGIVFALGSGTSRGSVQ